MKISTDVKSVSFNNQFLAAMFNKFGENSFTLNDARDILEDKFKIDRNSSEGKKALWVNVQDVEKSTYVERVSRGKYKIVNSGELMDTVNKLEEKEPAPKIKVATENPVTEQNVSEEEIPETISLVPLKDKTYVAHGCFDIIKTVVSNKEVFAPVWVSGLSGNGKTFGVEQACAHVGRELIIINISNETSEEDLIGSYVLENGDMKWQDGPVITAMRKGAVLCLDEIDQARASIMCLNTIAQGKPYFIKKTNELVIPQKGFTLIGTANTKGDGEGMDKFTGAQIMNEAFLERFAIIVEQDYPTKQTEKKILSGFTDNQRFIDVLIDIAQSVRENFDRGEFDVVLTTRRLVQIVKNYELFKDEKQAIALAVARFEKKDQLAILEIYSALLKQRDEEEALQKANKTNDVKQVKARKEKDNGEVFFF